MKSCIIAIIGLTFFTDCANVDYSGNWTCKSDKHHTLNIKEIAKNTYEISFDGTYTLTGEVNENDVLAVNFMGSKSLFILKNNVLHWFDGDCKEFIK